MRYVGGRGRDAGVATLLLCLWLSGALVAAAVVVGLVGRAADLDARAQTAADAAALAAAGTGGTSEQRAEVAREYAARNGAVVPVGGVEATDGGVTVAVYLPPAGWACLPAVGDCEPAEVARQCAAATTARPTLTPESCRSLPSATARAVPAPGADGGRSPRLVPLDADGSERVPSR